MRRALGPTSWMVLEELLLRSTGPADACVAQVSVRALAASLGLAKDTAGRAIRRLRIAGLVTVAQQRTDGGVFDTGTYLIAVPDCISLTEPTPARSHALAQSDTTPHSSRSRSSPENHTVMTTRVTYPFEEQTSARTRSGTRC